VFERMALEIQRQLQMVGVKVELEGLSGDELVTRVSREGDFDAALIDAVSGPVLVRPYLWWHSQGTLNVARFRSEKMDAALDSIRHAATDEAYRRGVALFQSAFIDDPPAI